MVTPEEFQAQHGHPGEACRVGEYDGKQTTCVQSWERAASGREASCSEWGEEPREPQEVCPSCGHYALWHDEYGCGKCVTPPARETSP